MKSENRNPIIKALMTELMQRPIAVYPIYIDIMEGDYAAAVALSQVLYWYGEKGNRQFYKLDSGVDKDGVDRSWQTELRMTSEQWRRVKAKLKTLPFLIIEKKSIPPKTFYSVDFDKFIDFVSNFERKKIKSANKTSFKPTNSTISGDLPPYVSGDLPPYVLRENPPYVSGDLPPYVLRENPQHNTKTTQRIHKDNNTEAQTETSKSDKAKEVVVVVFKFSDYLIQLNDREKTSFIKKLEKFNDETQQLICLNFAYGIKNGLNRSTPSVYMGMLINEARKENLSVVDDVINPVKRKMSKPVSVDNVEEQKEEDTLIDIEAQIVAIKKMPLPDHIKQMRINKILGVAAHE